MSRSDLHGLWWDDDEPVRGRGQAATVRTVEPPKTGWIPPRDLPNLKGVKLLGLDTETKDLELTTKGPGFIRKDAHIVGVSLATEDKAWYFPMRHEYHSENGMNMTPEHVLPWLNDVLQGGADIVGANLMYDLEALRSEGVKRPTGRLFDVQFAEPLIDENKHSYSLDSIAYEHLGIGKDTPDLYKWCADSFGGKADGTQREHIWRSPPSLVGPYAEQDAQLPLRIIGLQRKLLESEQLWDLFLMECELIPLLLDMRFRGVRIDVEKAHQTAKWLREEAARVQASLGNVDVWSNASLERAFKAAGIEVLYTEAGNPSFTKEWLQSQHYELAQKVLDVRLYEKAANPFVESYLLGNLIGDRVHCQFHPLRSDRFGTVSGRFSSSNPNLQNIPSRHKILGPLLRSLYIPEAGCIWARTDYSQIEYRALVHYAIGPGAEALREMYRNNPKTDFHQLAIDMTQSITGVTLDRTPAKNLNFGLVYGMGEDKTVRSLGVSFDIGKRLYDAYHSALPAVRETNKSAQRLANRRGYIKTFLGRRRRYPVMEDGKYGQTRVGAHAALNNCLQGTAADIMKKGMLECYKAGVFAPDACGIPHLTVHDELDVSIANTKKAKDALVEAQHILETCVTLKVPMMVKVTTGETWGACM